MQSDAEQPEVGRVVDGKYRLTRLLGRGGMGSVWEGVHTTLGTRFAVKYIDAAFAGRKDVETRFANEALAAARLKSKHIVEVYDHGVDDRGCPYIVMEFLSGEPLDRRLGRDAQLPFEEAVALVLQIARGLSRAHRAGIVHRDLKPENVFLVWDEDDQKTVVKLVDFGIAKFTDGTGVDSATRTGAVLGTPHYMSPEQARGLKTVDFAADVWSLGVIAYRAVTGRAPFEGEAVGDLLVKICTLPHAPPSDFASVPTGFDEWMATSLAKEPGQRFGSIAAQAEALAALLGPGEITLSRVGSFGERPPAEPAITAPMLGTPPGQRTDTEAGVERPRSGRAPSTRRVWLLGLPVLGLVAGAWLALRAEPRADGTDDAAAPPSLAVSGLEPAASSAASSGPDPLAVEAELPTAASTAEGGDAGVSAPTVSLGRPADSQAPELERPPRARRSRPPAARPEPARPALPPARDELGY